jgi:mono/diheme cytochrome c family protein
MKSTLKSKFRAGLPVFVVLPMLALVHQPTLALAQAEAPYRVVEGNKVDPATLTGWKTWRAMACERCHGANQEGLVGPSLINSLKILTKQEFVTTVTNGRVEKGMPNFGTIESVAKNVDGLYAYLKGRSDGAIKPGRLQALETP